MKLVNAIDYISGLVQDSGIYIADALEIAVFCTKPPIWLSFYWSSTKSEFFSVFTSLEMLVISVGLFMCWQLVLSVATRAVLVTIMSHCMWCPIKLWAFYTSNMDS